MQDTFFERENKYAKQKYKTYDMYQYIPTCGCHDECRKWKKPSTLGDKKTDPVTTETVGLLSSVKPGIKKSCKISDFRFLSEPNFLLINLWVDYI